MTAIRNNKGKLQWSLVDFDSLEDMVRVLEHGAKEYGVDNWKKGLKTKEIIESLLRHTFAYLRGENDDVSGHPHTGHILCNAMFLAYMTRFMPEYDNREVSENIFEAEEHIEANMREMWSKSMAEVKVAMTSTQPFSLNVTLPIDKNGNSVRFGDLFEYTEHEGYLLKSFTGIIAFNGISLGYMKINEKTGIAEQQFYSFENIGELEHDFFNHINLINI